GAMVAVQATEEEVRHRIADRDDMAVAVAAVNGPTSVVVSGDEDAVTELVGHFERTTRLKVSHAFHSPLMEPMLAEFGKTAAQLTYHEPRIPVVSNVTGRLADPADLRDPEYWVRHVRETVRFHDGIQALEEAGVRTFLEIGPQAVLSGLGCGDQAVFLAAQRRDQPEINQLITALGVLHTRGVTIDWAALFDGRGARTVDLPTYPFQHQRYWINSLDSAADVSTAGLEPAQHPLLGAVVALPTGDGVTLTGRLSLETQPWLADHAVLGSVLLPGSAFVEMAVRAGDEVGCPAVEELTLEAPLVLPERGALMLQVTVGEPDDSGRRPVAVHSRPEHDVRDADWTRHASGLLIGAAVYSEPVTGASGTEIWPPQGAAALGLAGFYDELADHGLRYGPAFQGLRSAWRRGDELFAEVVLPDHLIDGGAYGLHPALLDAALHVHLTGVTDGRSPGDGQDGPSIPFSWTGVRVYAAGASTLRVRLTGDGLEASDTAGAPVVSVKSLSTRPLPAEPHGFGTSAQAGDGCGLYRVNWVPAPDSSGHGSTPGWVVVGGAATPCSDGSPVPAALIEPAQGSEKGSGFPDAATLIDAVADGRMRAPDVVLLPVAAAEAVLPTPSGTAPEGVPAQLRAAVNHTLTALQVLLGDDRLSGSVVAVVTHRAVDTGEGDVAGDLTGPVQAAVWGLVRSAQEEEPGRVVLLDQDTPDTPHAVLAAAAVRGEPQLALRDGAARVPRLGGVEAAVDRSTDVVNTGIMSGTDGWKPDGTVLITGGTGDLGRLVARHLVTDHGMRELLLVSRRGAAAPGSADLVADLTALGARVRIEACDTGDRDALAGLLASVPADRPLTAVVHTAGVMDNALISSLSREQADAVLRPKADTAWHLHELTRDHDLGGFVLFSSAAGVLGAAGQGNYAAANAFLDALVLHRRGLGLPGYSLAWGLWQGGVGMTRGMGEADHSRMRRGGVRALTVEEGLRLFTAALDTDEPVLLPVRLDPAALRAAGPDVQAILSALVPAGPRGLTRTRTRTGDGGAAGGRALAERLAGLPAGERAHAVSDMVRAHVGAVLGHTGPDAIDPETTFQQLGFDSLAGIELRNQLKAATGLHLSAAVVFDHPTPTALARHLAGELAVDEADVSRSVLADVDRLEAALAALPLSEGESTRITGRLEALIRTWQDRLGDRPQPGEQNGDDLTGATDEELFEVLDSEFGL
ncbi:SDR family NAD(P)-dependent oxidoreductase, partial [Streptomyces sp. NPDC127084]|uniref:type I polyketide synthase n=1 Tax=Streptomyces sp. NPDC127084 TaxID=3347133 RepID=UPI003669B49B